MRKVDLTPRKISRPKRNPELEDNVLYIEKNEVCTKDYHSGEQWGEWERSYDISLVRCTRDKSEIVNDHSYETFNVSAETYAAKKVFIVTVTYESGDTFGRSYGNNQIAFVTHDEALALDVKNAIEAEDGSWDKYQGNEDGCGYASWDGYFERLNCAEVYEEEL